MVIPPDIAEEDTVLLTDVFPTGYQAAEMGLATEWRYNRAGFIRKAAIATARLAGATYLLRRRKD